MTNSSVASTDRAVVLMSGGLNSTVAAMRAIEDTRLHFLHVDFGQGSAGCERAAVIKIADALGAIAHLADLPTDENLLAAVGAEKNGGVTRVEGMESVARRRLPGVMLAMFGLAQQLAVRVGAGEVVCGASELCIGGERGGVDRRVPLDGRRVFFHAASVAIEMGMSTKDGVKVAVPFIDSTREDIIHVGQRLGTPFHLTWSCWVDGDGPCGGCGGCASRGAAFAAVGIQDPMTAGVGQSR